jgi:hypothetical protein
VTRDLNRAGSIGRPPADSAGTCTTITGLPRKAELSCCSHDAKKALRSRDTGRHSRPLTRSSFVLYARGSEMTSPTMPPRYAFHLDDLRSACRCALSTITRFNWRFRAAF